MLEHLGAYLAPLATLAVFLAGVAYTAFVDPDMYHFSQEYGLDLPLQDNRGVKLLGTSP